MLAYMRDRPGTVGEPQSFRTADIDVTRALCARFFYDVRLEPIGPVDDFAFAADVVRLGPVTVGDLRFGSDVSIATGDMLAYHVSLPVAGRMESEHRGTVTTATPRRAAVYQPYGSARTGRWAAECRTLCLKFEREAVEAEAEALLDRPVRGPLRLGAALEARRGPGLTWLRMAHLLRAEFDNQRSLLFEPRLADRYGHALIGGLLMAVDHQYAAELAEPARPGPPRAVRRAIEAIRADPARPLSTTALARLSGTGVRSLQEAFRQHVGQSPITYLRQVRLERAHAELCRPSDGRQSVAAIAHGWGFGHLGRFAAAYRARYGVSPSETLRGRYSPGSP
jgi:AraC-like DNA-binding protein